MKNRITQTLTLALAATLLAACQDYLPLGGVTDGGTGNNPASNLFNFSTTKEVSVNINYGKKGARALVNLYTEDPQYMVPDDNEVYISDDAEFSVFLDENGRFNGKVNLPADTRKVWVYTSRPGLPELQMTNVSGNGDVTATYSENPVTDTEYHGFTDPSTFTTNTEKEGYKDTKDFEEIGKSTDEKTGKEYKIWRAAIRGGDANEETYNRIFTITNWQGQRFGRIKKTHYYDKDGIRHNVKGEEGKHFNTQGLLKDFSNSQGHVNDPDSMGTDDIEIIQQFLWNGKTTKPAGLRNRLYYKDLDTEDINITIPHSYINNGDLTTVDSAQVWLRFLGEGAYYCDGIGYYYYDTNNPPEKQTDIKAYYVVFPNTSSTAPYTPTEKPEDNEFKGRTVPFITYYSAQDKLWTTDLEDGEGLIHYTVDTEIYDANTGTYKTEPQPGETRTWHPKFVPFDINQRMQLLYHEFEWEKKDGSPGDVAVTKKVSKYFPPGITIGFFLCWASTPDGGWYKSDEPNHKTYRIPYNTTFFHSNWRINSPKIGNTVYEYDDNGEGKVGSGGIWKEPGTGYSKVGDGKNVKTISKRHFIALNYKNFAVYGVEDGVDDSMGDVLFTIKTDPIGIVVNDDRVTIEQGMNATTTNHRTYCFEDIWPTGGDYDMNDVVIDHHHRMTIHRDGDGNTENDWITKIEDDFIPIQPTGSADYQDAFGFQVPISRWEGEGKLTVLKDGEPYTDYRIEYEDGRIVNGANVKKDTDSTEEGGGEGEPQATADGGDNTESGGNEQKEEEKVTIILFTNAKDENVQYSKYTVIREFSTEFAKKNTLHIEATQLEDKSGKNVLNPFIISQADKNMGEGRIEIHLPGQKPTIYGKKLSDGSAASYYVAEGPRASEGEIYPYAISLPRSAFNYPWGQHFTNLNRGEAIPIDDEEKAYPDYVKWVKSEGETNTDWYKNLRPEKSNDTTQSE